MGSVFHASHQLLLLKRTSLLSQEEAIVLKTFRSSVQPSCLKPDHEDSNTMAARHENVLHWMSVHLVTDESWCSAKAVVWFVLLLATEKCWGYQECLTWIDMFHILLGLILCKQWLIVQALARRWTKHLLLHHCTLPQPCCPKAEGLPLTDFAQTPKENLFL